MNDKAEKMKSISSITQTSLGNLRKIRRPSSGCYTGAIVRLRLSLAYASWDFLASLSSSSFKKATAPIDT